MKETQRLTIPAIELNWSDWTSWEDTGRNVSEGGANLPHAPGVYEVGLRESDERLIIGRGSSLRMRVKQGLVKGDSPHSGGERIKEALDSGELDVRDLVVRWASTASPAAAEEELHKQHKDRFDDLPKYTMTT